MTETRTTTHDAWGVQESRDTEVASYLPTEGSGAPSMRPNASQQYVCEACGERTGVRRGSQGFSRTAKLLCGACNPTSTKPRLLSP